SRPVVAVLTVRATWPLRPGASGRTGRPRLASDDGRRARHGRPTKFGEAAVRFVERRAKLVDVQLQRGTVVGGLREADTEEGEREDAEDRARVDEDGDDAR